MTPFRISREWAPLPLRLMLGAGFFYHGWLKVFSPGGHQLFAGMLGSLGLPAPAPTAWLVAWTEIIGGLALIAGEGTAHNTVGQNYIGRDATVSHRALGEGDSFSFGVTVSVWAFTSASTFATPSTAVNFFTSFPAHTSQSMSGTVIVR